MRPFFTPSTSLQLCQKEEKKEQENISRIIKIKATRQTFPSIAGEFFSPSPLKARFFRFRLYLKFQKKGRK